MTQFGAKITTGDPLQQKEVLDKLGINILRIQKSLKDYNGNIALIEKLFPLGVKFELNISWQGKRLDNQPLDFCTDLIAYERQLRKLYNKYADKILFAVCENEPTTDVFYKNGQIEKYINVLKVFARISKEYGVQNTDGCVHLENLWYIMHPLPHRVPKNVPDVQAIITAIKDIPELDYANFHFEASDLIEYPPDRIKLIVDFLRAQTGKEVVNNEWHVGVNDPRYLNYHVVEIKKAAPVYSLIWGGGGTSKAPAINEGTDLTTIGKAYRDAVAGT
jgi:hypothetical protein